MAELRVVTALVAKRAEMIKADKEQEEPDGEKMKPAARRAKLDAKSSSE